jgi:glycosyltransferase involved in cell wall biosynthesis
MPDADVASVAEALARVLGDKELRDRLGRAGIETAQEYAWEKRIDALERFLQDVAAPRRLVLGDGPAVLTEVPRPLGERI